MVALPDAEAQERYSSVVEDADEFERASAAALVRWSEMRLPNVIDTFFMSQDDPGKPARGVR